jgi:hypothetical protein
VAVVVLGAGAAQAHAQTVTGLTVTQRDGFATLK